MKILFYYRGAESFGIEYISAALQDAGHTTGLIFDPGFDDTFYFKTGLFNFLNVKEKLSIQAKRFSPDIIAFSSTTNLYPYVRDMARSLKKVLKVPVIIGGIHATALPEYVLKEECFDMLCVGEGEYAMVELADKMEQGRDFFNIGNIWFKRNGNIVRNPERPLIENLDTLPFPDKDMFYNKGAFYKNVQLSTSRGCPYRCTFCVNSFYFNKYGNGFLRRVSAGKVIEELRTYRNKYNPKFINFQDDVFAQSLAWLEEFTRKYKNEIGVKFVANIHPSMVNEKSAILLKEGGCFGVCMGIQTGNEDLRRRILKRNETNAQIKKAAQLLKEAGIRIISEFIFALPHETPEQAWESVTVNEEIKPSATSTFVFYPFPGTELAEYAYTNNLLGDDEINLIKEGRGSYHTALFLKNMSNDFFVNLSYLLPLYVKMPRFINRAYFKKICQRNTSFLHKMIGVASIPFHNPILFKEKLVNYLRMFWVYLCQ